MYVGYVDEKLEHKPSEYLTGGYFFASIEVHEGSPSASTVIDEMGDGILMFGTDYPHAESRFPESTDTVRAWQNDGVPEPAMRKWMWENAVRCFGQPRPAQYSRFNVRREDDGMDATDHTHIATNGRAEVTLDELASLHGGLAHFMLEISDRATRCHQACVAHNRLVARHHLGELTKTMRLAVLVRPQYADAIERFIAEELAPIRTMIDDEDWDHFDERWDRLTIAVNNSHEEFDHGYLVWRVPTDAPSDLDLTPKASGSPDK